MGQVVQWNLYIQSDQCSQGDPQGLWGQMVLLHQMNLKHQGYPSNQLPLENQSHQLAPMHLSNLVTPEFLCFQWHLQDLGILCFLVDLVLQENQLLLSGLEDLQDPEALYNLCIRRYQEDQYFQAFHHFQVNQ